MQDRYVLARQATDMALTNTVDDHVQIRETDRPPGATAWCSWVRLSRWSHRLRVKRAIRSTAYTQIRFLCADLFFSGEVWLRTGYLNVFGRVNTT